MILADPPHPDTKKEKTKLPMVPLPWLLGLMALFSMVPEGAVLDWGALYLRQEMDASVALSGLGFAAFSATMAIMRFGGDLVRDRLGGVNTLRICTLFAIVGMLLAGLAPNAEIAILGFAFCGIGISNMVPIAFSAAGNIPGLKPGIAISVVTTMGYSGMLVAPSLIGFVAEHIGFAVVFMALPVLLIVVLLLSKLAHYADGTTGGGH
jgi:fucose permease